MYLKKLHISNFRCFRDYTIEFAPGVTVLFGKNGSGKSTLIHAIHKAMSFMFKKDTKSKNALNLAAGFDSIGINQFSKKSDIVRDVKTGFPLSEVNIHAEANMLGADLEWDICASMATFAVQPSKFSKAYSLLISRIKETNELPVLSYISDSFPHVSTKASGLTQSQLALRNLGYLGWDEETAYSDLWITRFSKIWKQWSLAVYNISVEEAALKNCDIFKENGKLTDEEYKEDMELHHSRLANAQKDKVLFDNEVKTIIDSLVRFSKGDPNLEVINLFVSPYEESGLCLQTKDGSNPSVEQLPAGYKRLIYMVMDIAYRSFILSEGKSTDMPGLVIIDEVDLHLHPELEQTVLERLARTFPSMQFIVSTHSPLVLTGVETQNGKNRIMKMTPTCDAPIEWYNIHGIDYNQMLEENMDVCKRKPEIEALFDKAWKEVADKNIEAAKNTVKELESKTPADQIELVQLRAIIERIEIVGK